MRRGSLVSNWLMGDDRVLPRRLRWAFFASGCVVLGGSYAATDSEGFQVLAWVALFFGVFPAVTRAFGERNDLRAVARKRNAPFAVTATSLAFLVPWGGVVLVLVPELGLGPWFWSWVLLWPSLEVYVYLAERRLRRDGGASWKPVRPWRDSLLAGLATSPVIIVIFIAEGLDLGEALLTGFLCGGILSSLSGAFTWMAQRATG